jgi:hypothetical protein
MTSNVSLCPVRGQKKLLEELSEAILSNIRTQKGNYNFSQLFTEAFLLHHYELSCQHLGEADEKHPGDNRLFIKIPLLKNCRVDKGATWKAGGRLERKLTQTMTISEEVFQELRLIRLPSGVSVRRLTTGVSK